MNRVRIIMIVFVAGLGWAFQVIDTAGVFERPAMFEYYHERMTDFRQQELEECQQKALSMAKARVDSVLTGKKILVEVDSFLLRPTPKKPDRPEFTFEVDSAPVEPLFGKKDTAANSN